MQIRVRFRQRDQRTIEAAGSSGQSVRDLALAAKVMGILGECGGNCACGTCHVVIDNAWIDRIGRVVPGSVEDATLDFSSNREPNSRLSCQIALQPELDGLIVTVGNDV